MSDIIPQKRCTGICQRLLPATPDYFHRNGQQGLRPDCKECRGKKVKAYQEQPEVHEHIQAYRKNYLQENADRVNAHKREYYSQPEVKAHQSECMKAVRSQPGFKERKSELSKVWTKLPYVREKRRPYDRIAAHKRRTIEKASGNYTVQQVQDLLRLQKYKCSYCLLKFDVKQGKHVYHIDHVVPLARGGSNEISNIVLACPSCNQHKQARLPHEWPEGGKLL